jgi:hypothetical protein
VLLLTAETAVPDTKVVTSLMITMMMLLKAMNEEMLFLNQIAEPLKDFNENRLTTFEVLRLLALLVQKYKY